MERSLISETAEALVDSYRDVLCIDQFYKIKIEIIEGEFISLCEVDINSPASWILKINPERHTDFLDIKQSVIDCLLRIIFRYITVSEFREEVISRIASAFSTLLPDLSDDDV